jgi:hypothetical protein
MNVKNSGTALRKGVCLRQTIAFAIDNKYISLHAEVSAFNSEPLPLSDCTLNTTMMYGW